MVAPRDTGAFLAERRAIARDRYDTVHAADYDTNWGEVQPAHRAHVARLLGASIPTYPPGSWPCGTCPGRMTAWDGGRAAPPRWYRLPDPRTAGGTAAGAGRPRQVVGESVGAGYHYHPRAHDVLTWLAGAGFTVLSDRDDGDWYRHLPLRAG